MGSCTNKHRPPPSISKVSTPQIQVANKTFDSIVLKPIIRPVKHINTPNIQLMNVESKSNLRINQKMKVKVPINPQKTRYVWMQQQITNYPEEIKFISHEVMRYAKFQQKLTWFRLHLQSMRISWETGSDVLRVDRSNIVHSSLLGLNAINFHKELKIQFTDEKVDDAGGLLRQWMHLCIKEILSKQMGIFGLCVTDETAYKILWDKNIVEEVALQAINLLGIIIGKAIFQRISLNCCLNRTILRQICSQPVYLEDVYSFDSELYETWTRTLYIDNVAELELNGCAYHNHGENDLQEVQLFPNGANTQITNANRDQYLTEIINLYCTKSISNYLKALRTSIYKIIPANLLSIFEPNEIEMILNGPLTIDIRDWKANTQYENCEITTEVVKWFWQCVQHESQDRLKNLLHYCTGSTRVPILGFKYLESNRGEIRHFTLRLVDYDSGNPYPKSHICFNRLDLPKYSSRYEVRENVRVLMQMQLNHFGLD